MAKINENYKAIILRGKRARMYANRWKLSSYIMLEDAYKNYSMEKSRAYFRYFTEEQRDKGIGGKIIGYNNTTFTYAYLVDKTKLIVITYAHKYIIDLEDMGGK